MKKIAISFSGGLDSTYLMWKNLKDGHEVHPFYVEVGNNVNKRDVELCVIKLMLEDFKKDFGEERIKELKVHSIYIDIDNSNMSFAQVHFFQIQIGLKKYC